MFYGIGGKYESFSGRDASIQYSRGVGTEEVPIEKEEDISNIVEWHKFYWFHETYELVGRLVDPRYYDENGQPTAAKDELTVKINKVIMKQNLEREKNKDSKTKDVSIPPIPGIV